MKQSFSGNFNNCKPSWSFNKGTEGKRSHAFANISEKLLPVIERLKTIQIENIDFKVCIQRYDTPDTLFYCDPPYYEKEYYYEGGFTRQNHIELSEILNNIKGKACLSYYEFPDMLEWYPADKWRIERKNVSKCSQRVGVGGTKSIGEEILLMNY